MELIKLKKLLKLETLRGGRQSLMMKGSLNVDDDKGDENKLDELHFNADILNQVRKSVLDFIISQHKKLKYKNPLDTYHLIKQVLGSDKIFQKIKGIK